MYSKDINWNNWKILRFRRRYMTEKELKRLNRTELLELLLIQTRETERLQRKLDAMENRLTDWDLMLEKAGDIAHAALEINGVMEAAQAAAQQYLDNIMRMEQETAQRCEKMLSDARQQLEVAQKKGSGLHTEDSDQDVIGQINALLDE